MDDREYKNSQRGNGLFSVGGQIIIKGEIMNISVFTSKLKLLTPGAMAWRVVGVFLIVLPVLFVITFMTPLYLKRLNFDRTQNRSAVNYPDDHSFDVTPVSLDFGLVIPKIKVNVPVVADVNGDVSKIYFQKLKEGVAHFAGTAKPDQNSNTVIFGHSSQIPGVSDTPYAETFLLLDKLKKGDQISVYYHNQAYQYTVDTVKSRPEDALDVLLPTDNAQLTIFTCWPPGTDFKRMVVVSHRV